MPGSRPCLDASFLLAMVFTCGTLAGQSPCDSLHTVDFSWQVSGGNAATFSVGIPLSGNAVWSAEWGFAGEGYQATDWGQGVTHTFPAPGEYLVCMLATVEDLQQGTCLSAACQLVPVPVDSLCAALEPEFSIAFQDGALLFSNDTQSAASLTSIHWDFGDGTNSTAAAPLHTYSGYGPYEACLTITSGPCTATACNWIYLGPSEVPCENLLQADFHLVQLGRAIAVFDHSITSGMEHSIGWEFGDGHSASGSPVVHMYDQDGVYEVCATVDLWGPLTSDTCTATTCATVYTFVAAGLPGHERTPALHAYPVPFVNDLTVEPVPADAYWQLLDLQGRLQLAGNQVQGGTLTFRSDGLAQGTYLLLVRSTLGVGALRVLKK